MDFEEYKDYGVPDALINVQLLDDLKQFLAFQYMDQTNQRITDSLKRKNIILGLKADATNALGSLIKEVMA